MARPLPIAVGVGTVLALTTYAFATDVVSRGPAGAEQDPHLGPLYFHPDNLPIIGNDEFRTVAPYATKDELAALVTSLHLQLDDVCPDPAMGDTVVMLGVEPNKTPLCLNIGGSTVKTVIDEMSREHNWLQIAASVPQREGVTPVDLGKTFANSTQEQCALYIAALDGLADRVIREVEPTAYEVGGRDYRVQIVMDVDSPSPCDQDPPIKLRRSGGPVPN